MNFNVGDYVRIRDWDDMAKEFGISGGDIKCRCTFTSGMRELCGEVGKISKLYDYGGVVEIINENEKRIAKNFNLSIDMIEHISPELIPKYTFEELLI